MAMRRVILESPFGSNPAVFIPYARACLKDTILRGEAALASHLLYTQPGVLDDAVAGERALGMEAGFSWHEFAEAVVVYRDFGISEGMRRGIFLGERYGLSIEYRHLPMPNDGFLRSYPGVCGVFPSGQATEAEIGRAALTPMG